MKISIQGIRKGSPFATVKLVLRLPSRADMSLVNSWRTDPRVAAMVTGSSRVMTREQLNSWYSCSLSSPNLLRLMIEVRETGDVIGFAGLYNVDFEKREAELGILIGEVAEWGKGYATEAVDKMLSIGFKALELASVYLEVRKENLTAMKLYHKMGFEIRGVTKSLRCYKMELTSERYAQVGRPQ